MPDFYGSTSGADTYHSDRGNAAWAALSGDTTSFLVRASQYIDGRYRRILPTGRWQSMFSGTKTGGRAQVLEWPRTGATDIEGNAVTGIPREIEYATYEAALLVASGTDLSPVFVATEQVIREKVDVIEQQYVNPAELMKAGITTLANRPIFPQIDEIVAPLITLSAVDADAYGLTGFVV